MHVRRGHCDELRVRPVAVLADHMDRPVRLLDAWIDHDALPDPQPGDAVAERRDDPGAVGAEDARLRHRRQALTDPDVEMVQRGRVQSHEHLARSGNRIGDLFEDQHLGTAVGVDPGCAHGRHTIRVKAGELQRLGAEVGLDVVGATPAVPYDETERHIRERRARGLFADMRFTMAQPERSCHPETLLPGARTVVSGALCYYAPEPRRPAHHGRLPRYTWWDGYAVLREKLDELGRRLGGNYRVLVDANQHVDREAAARSGVGFYGKNTMLITRRHGSWVVLGTLITDRELEPTSPLDTNCGECTLCIDACPTDALEEAGTLDATRCLSYWTQAPAPIPEQYREHIDSQVYGCDICQDVCPWNRGVEKRRAGETPPPGAEPHVSLAAWLREDPAELRARYERLYVPENDGRWLLRNALVAAGNVGDREAIAAFVDHDDELLREHARWARDRIERDA
jgi:epoxyqueuosine reductase